MDITILPETKSSEIIQDNFLTQLSHWVDIKGNASNRKIQIFIFKPVGRPKEEFDHVIKTFGKRLDDVTIFITATKPDRHTFEPPLKFNFALQTNLFLNDENDIEQSSYAMDEIARFLKREYGFQSSSRVISQRDKLTSDDKTKGDIQRHKNAQTQENKRLKKEVERLQRQVCDLELKTRKDLLFTVYFSTKVDIQRHKNAQTQENKRLKKEVERLQQQVCDLELKTRKDDDDRCIQVIRFEVEDISRLGCFSGQRTRILDVSLYAVESEIGKIKNKSFSFQRTYEKVFHLEPGTLRKILEFILREWKNFSCDGFIIEGQSFQSLTAKVNDKFQLPPDRFQSFLKRIYKRHVKGKEKRIPLCRDNMALEIRNETYPGYGSTSTTV